MAFIGSGISHRGIVQEEFNFPFNLATTIVAADVGKAVSIDTTAARTVKLAADGDVIQGWLTSYEDRTIEGGKVGTVSMKGGTDFLRASGAPAVTVGAVICGAGAGEVRAALVDDGSAIKTHRTIATFVNGRAVEVILT
jgi:hypothetical protein